MKPRRSTFLSPDAEEIGLGIASRTAILFSIATVADPRFEWPSPLHLRIILSPVPKKQKRDAF
ncbi:MAG: hypothetical protein DME75_07100 [Verrucomicrobia bacterium]|nr:MAG: hypothetical protein DME75_07100 [Verrucomicrobiota bacterium]